MSELANFFTDPITRGPLIASMLICFVCSLVGVFLYVRRQTLIGESLSHAAYPGVLIGLLFANVYIQADHLHSLFALSGAFVASFCGYLWMRSQVLYLKVKDDGALCFVLSSFFGFGILLASRLQFTHNLLYKQAIVYLYGQASTMLDSDIYIYSILSLFVFLSIIAVFKDLKICSFDRSYAQTMGRPVKLIETFFLMLVVLSIILGIASVGVVLITAMLIAPAVAARQWTDSLSKMIVLSAIIGVISALFGTILSMKLSESLSAGGGRVSIPTGPTIVSVASALCFFSLFFAPQRGYFFRKLRGALFYHRCAVENTLKWMWKERDHGAFTYYEICDFHNQSRLFTAYLVFKMRFAGFIHKTPSQDYILTEKGIKRTIKIVRLHRLWEVYLVEHCEMGANRVHKNAEEIEHIITPEIESALNDLLENPTQDPHHQPIPQVQ